MKQRTSCPRRFAWLAAILLSSCTESSAPDPSSGGASGSGGAGGSVSTGGAAGASGSERPDGGLMPDGSGGGHFGARKLGLYLHLADIGTQPSASTPDYLYVFPKQPTP